MAEAGLVWLRGRAGGWEGGERERKDGGVGGTAFQAGRAEGDSDWGAVRGVEYSETVVVEPGVE
jgi:hypothetical protein